MTRDDVLTQAKHLDMQDRWKLVAELLKSLPVDGERFVELVHPDWRDAICIEGNSQAAKEAASWRLLLRQKIPPI